MPKQSQGMVMRLLRSARNDSTECYQESLEKRRCVTNHLNEYKLLTNVTQNGIIIPYDYAIHCTIFAKGGRYVVKEKDGHLRTAS